MTDPSILLLVRISWRLLLLVTSGAILSVQQGHGQAPFDPQCNITSLNDSVIRINDFDTISLRFLVTGANRGNIGSNFQGICGVGIEFRHSNLSDLNMTLTSPNGNEVIIIGPANGNGTFPNILQIRHDLIFRPRPVNVNPHPVLSNPWDNNNLDWGQNESIYDGSYYPNFGDFLMDYVGDNVNGIWELTIVDPFLNNEGIFESFEMEFCDDSGLQCNACEAVTGTFNFQDTLKTCLGLQENLRNHYTPGDADPALYDEEFFVYDQSGALVMADPNPDLSFLDEGIYTAYAFNMLSVQYDTARLGIIRQDLFSLLSSVRSAGGFLCMDISEGIVIEVKDAGSISVDVAASPSSFNCAADTVKLTYTAPFTAQDVRWFFDGNPIREFDGITQVTITSEGRYDVEVTNEFGCIVAGSTIVTSDLMPPSASISAPVITCLNSEVTVDYTTSSLILENHWIRTSTGDTIGSAPNVVLSEPGQYELVLKGLNECTSNTGFEVQSNSEFIQVSNIPSGDIILNCIDTDLIVSPDRDDSELLEEYWIYGANDTIRGAKDITITEANSYRYVVVGNNGCVNNTTRFDVFVDTLAPMYQTSFDSITCVVSEAQIVLTNLTNAFVGWNAQGIVSQSDSSVLVNQEGIVNFTIVDTTNGCFALDSVLIVRNETTPAILLGGDTEITCQNPEAQVNADFDGSLIDQFFWRNPRGDTLTDQRLVVEQAGNYTFEATGINGCPFSGTWTVEDRKDAPAIDLPDEIKVSCTNRETNLSVTDLTGIDQVRWVLDSDTLIGPDLNVVTNIPAIEAQIIGINGCPNSKVIDIEYDTIAPDFILLSDTINCFNDSVIIRPNIALDHHIFTWAGGAVDGSNAPEVAVMASGAYALNVFDTLNGCFGLAPINVEEDFSTPTFTVLSMDTLTCNRTSVSISIDTDDANSVIWTTMNGRIVEDPTILSDMSGFHIYEVIGTNGCSLVDSVELIADIATPRVLIEDTYELSCDNNEETLIPNILDPFTSLEWSFKNGRITQNMSEVLDEKNVLESLTVTGINGCQTRVDFTVTFANDIPLAVINTADTVVCDGNSIFIDTDPVVITTHQITWFDGNLPILQNNTNAEVFRSGNYVLEVRDTSSGCFTNDTVSVVISPNPFITVEFDAMGESCLDDGQGFIQVTQVEGGVGDVRVLLDDQVIGFVPVEPLTGGTYRLSLTDSLQCSIDTLIEIKMGETLSVELGDDFEVERGDPVLLLPAYSGDQPVSVFWIANGDTISTSIDSLSLTASEDLMIVIVASTLNGCVARDSINIEVFVDINKVSVYVPNILNLNSQQGNDRVVIELAPDIVEITDFSIFDRWGERVAYLPRVNSGEVVLAWDGSLNGSPVTPGVYVYYYEMQTIYDTRRRKVTGDITVIR